MMFGHYRKVYEKALLQGKGGTLMAGIGFELRRLLRKNTLVGLIEGLRLCGRHRLRALGVLHRRHSAGRYFQRQRGRTVDFLVTQFQTSVTYLVASSLILTGVVQLAFTRFVSDRLFEKRSDAICPTCTGCCWCCDAVASVARHAGAVRLLPRPWAALPPADAGRLRIDVRRLGTDHLAVRHEALQGHHGVLFGLSPTR
jgi:hypothetical protein